MLTIDRVLVVKVVGDHTVTPWYCDHAQVDVVWFNLGALTCCSPFGHHDDWPVEKREWTSGDEGGAGVGAGSGHCDDEVFFFDDISQRSARF